VLAVTKTRPERGVEILERPEPPAPGEGEVLLEVAACGVCGTDLHFYEWVEHAGVEITLPRILGHEVAATVAEVGPRVTAFAPGDRVVTETWGGCGRCHLCRLGLFNQCEHQRRLGQAVDGGMARFVVVPELSLYAIPDELPFDEAAVIEPAGVALHAFELASSFRPGDSVAVLGPGPIGLLAAMLADRAGAGRVIVSGLAADAERLEFARRLGCDVVSADQGDPAAEVRELTGGYGADLVIDTSGGPGTVSDAVELVRRGGEVVLVGLSPPAPFDPSAAVVKEVTLRGAFRRQPVTWLRTIRLVATRRMDVRSLVTHRLPISRAEEAFEILLARQGIKAIVTPD
jgi:2-desacetyl-2-hydroxyethyl bacteriochlorophyllide A dehydrogenase